MRRQGGSASEALKKQGIDLLTEKEISGDTRIDSLNTENSNITNISFFQRYRDVISSTLYRCSLVTYIISFFLPAMLFIMEPGNDLGLQGEMLGYEVTFLGLFSFLHPILFIIRLSNFVFIANFFVNDLKTKKLLINIAFFMCCFSLFAIFDETVLWGHYVRSGSYILAFLSMIIRNETTKPSENNIVQEEKNHGLIN